jgi:hypothetical protein
MRTILGVALCTVALLTGPVLAETAANPVTDLASMRAKAEANSYFADMLDQLSGDQGGQSNARRQMIRQLMNGSGRNGNLDLPFAYRDAANVQMAQMRGQFIAQILTSDLNNDGDVTKDELRTALQNDRNGQNGQAASAFFSSDADTNDVLSAAEIREAASLFLRGQGEGRYQDQAFAMVFDFDDDGILTQPEFERGEKALGL